MAIGYSDGADIAASLMLLHPHHLAAAVLFRPMVPFSPAVVRNLSHLAVFIGAGTTDPRIPKEQPEELALMLGAGGRECNDLLARWGA